MKHLFSLLSIAVLISCQPTLVDDTSVQLPRDTFVYDCEFIEDPDNMDARLDSVEWGIMANCRQNRFRNKRQISNNLIGEWELVGFAWPQVDHKTQPCGYITIDPDSLVFEFQDANLDKRTVHSWEVERVGPLDEDHFVLATYPNNYTVRVGTFCKEYMYRSLTGIDGPTHIYQKVKE